MPKQMNANEAAISTLLGRTPEWWDSGMLASLGIAAIAAMAVLLFTAGSVIANKRSAHASALALERYKLETEGKVADAHKAGIAAGETASAAHAEAEAAKLEIAKQQTRAAQLEKEAAEAKLEQERIKALVAWREWDPQVANRLVAELSKTPGGANFEYDASDTEAKAYAIQLANLFERAGWRLGLRASANVGALSFGIFLPDGPEPATSTVRRAFQAAGVPFTTESPPTEGVSFGGSRGPDFARVVVGSKPPPLNLARRAR